MSGLSRGGFFDEAAFYGGTALRIFHKLDIFSEGLDFALVNKKLDLSKYFVYIEKELKSYGLNLKINTKQKSKDSNITSAFLKGDTLGLILKFFPNEENHEYDHLLQNIKIKFEIDINPSMGATYEIQYKLLPSPHQKDYMIKNRYLQEKFMQYYVVSGREELKEEIYMTIFFS